MIDINQVVVVFLSVLGGSAMAVAWKALKEERENNAWELKAFGLFAERLDTVEKGLDILSERFAENNDRAEG